MMGRIFSVFFAAALSIASLRAQTPDAVILFEPPQKLFPAISETMRKIYPDPRSEMLLALTLSPVGYPNFNGVSNDQNMGICVFDTGEVVTAAIYASKESAISRFSEGMSEKPAKIGDWLIMPLFTPRQGFDISGYAEATAEAMRARHSANLASAQADAAFILAAIEKYAGYKVSSNLAQDIESARITLDIDGPDFVATLRIVAKDGTLLKTAFNKFSWRTEEKEARFIPQDAAFTFLSSVYLGGKNTPLTMEMADRYFGDRYSQKYAKLLEKFEGSFAMTEGDKGGGAVSVSVSSTKITMDELLEYVAELYKSSGSEDKIEFCEIGGTKAVTNSAAEDAARMYWTVADGYMVNSDNPETLARTVEKVRAESGSDAPYKLQRYAKLNADFVLIMNNNTLLNSVLKSFGMGYTDENFGSDFTIEGKIGMGRMDLAMRADMATIRAYADIFRKLREAVQDGKN